MSQPVFNIIIPCKDRAKYLEYTLKTCSKQDYERLNIVVSDDNSSDETRDIVMAASSVDRRIKYFRPRDGSGMLYNFEYALSKVEPGYVIALGGDDGLMQNSILDMLEILECTDTKALTWPAPVYTYPGVRSERSQLTIYRDKGLKILDSKKVLQRQARNLHYLSDTELPMFYVKGVVHSDIIDQVKSRSPKKLFYSCPTPDGYSGIVIAGEVEKYAYSGRPFSVYGVSPSSQGLAYLSNLEKDKLASEKFYRDVTSRPMHRCLGSGQYSPLITLMTVDYLMTARDLSGWPGIFPEINFKQVLEKALEELSNGLYGETRLVRELEILSEIARLHGLEDYFKNIVSSKRRKVQRAPFVGTGLNRRTIIIDGANYNIKNIVEAVYAVGILYQVYIDLQLPNIIKTLMKSFVYGLKSARFGGRFPKLEGNG